jgi:hypothetical protein
MDWAPHSPDITLSDLFLWGYVQANIYTTTVRDWIVEAVGTITLEMLQRTCVELDYRLDILHVTIGTHVEVHRFF